MRALSETERPIEFPEPEPEAVDAAKMLTDLVTVIRWHVVMPDHAAVAVALWMYTPVCLISC